MNTVGDSLVHLLKNIQRAQKVDSGVNWDDALSEGQLASKAWLIDELAKVRADLGLVYVLGGWAGILPALMFYDERLTIKAIRSFDIDDGCRFAAEMVNRRELIDGWRFKATTDNMFKMDYDECSYTVFLPDGTPHPMLERPDTIINTSCDHIAPFERWWSRIPSGKLCILQNNDYKGDEDHVNCVPDLETMMLQARMTSVLYQGSKKFAKYNRFMLIGYK